MLTYDLLTGNEILLDKRELEVELDPRYVNIVGDTMTGALKINTNSTTALLVEQDGVKDNVLVVDTTNARTWVNGRIGINRSPQVDFDVVKDGQGVIQMTSYSDTGATDGTIIWNRGRGTTASPTALQSNDGLGSFQFKGYYDSSNISTSRAKIQVLAEENWSSTNQGARIVLFTTPAGSTTLATAMTVKGSGLVGIGSSIPTAMLHIFGNQDTQQLIVKGNATQTANLMEWQNSSGTVLASIEPDGDVNVLSTNQSFTTLDANAFYCAGGVAAPLIVGGGFSGLMALGRGVAYDFKTDGTQTGSTPNYTGAMYLALAGTGNTGFNSANYARLQTSNSSNYSFAMVNLSRLVHAGSGTINDATNLDLGAFVSGGGSLVRYSGIRIQTPSITVGSISTAYGVLVENITGATNNYAIYTNAGLVRFGDATTINTNSTTALVVEQDGVKDNVLVVDTTNGRVGIGSSPAYKFHLYGGITSDTIAYFQSDATDSANQDMRIYLRHYTAAEEPFMPLFASSNNGSNYVSYGGGSSLANAATLLRFYTAANQNTVTGTVRIYVNAAGNVGIGSVDPSTVGRFVITGSADQVQSVVRGHSTQTTNLQEWQNSSAGVLASITGDGRLGIGVAPATNSFFDLYKTITDPVAETNVSRLRYQFTATSGTNTYTNRGFYTISYAGGTQDYSGTLRAISGEAYNNGSGTVATMYGLLFSVGNTSSGNTTNAYIARLATFSTGAGTFGTVYGASVGNLSAYSSPTTTVALDVDASTTAVGTTKYGLRIGNLSGATSNYAIYTNAGLNQLGDQLKIDGSADRIQLLVQGHSTQTTNLQEWQNSSGTVLANFTGSGQLVINDTSGVANYSNLRVKKVFTDTTDVSGALNTFEVTTLFSPASASSANVKAAKYYVNMTGSQNMTGSVMGFWSQIQNSNTGTLATTYGFRSQIQNLSSGTMTTVASILAESIGNTGGGTITNAYGLLVNSQTAGTNNYAILTNAGNIVFNEGGDASTDFRVESDTEANMLFVDANADTDGAVYLGGTTNGIKVNKGGELTLLGTATVFNDVRVEPVVRGTAGVKTPAFVNWFGGLYLYEFDDAIAAQEKEFFFILQMPHDWKEGSAIEPHVHWSNKTAGTAGQVVRWGLEYSKAKIGDTFSSTPTTIYGTTIVGGGDITVANEHMYTDFSSIDMTGDTISTVLICRVFRNSSNAADTYTGIAGMLYVDFHYEIDSLGSKTETAK